MTIYILALKNRIRKLTNLLDDSDEDDYNATCIQRNRINEKYKNIRNNMKNNTVPVKGDFICTFHVLKSLEINETE